MNFRRNLAHLSKVFPPGGGGVDQLSPLVVVTFPLLGNLLFGETPKKTVLLGAADVLANESSAVPTSKVWVISAAQFDTDDAVVRQGQLSMASGSTVINLVNTTDFFSGHNLALPCPILLPSGTTLRGDVNALTLGAKVNLRFLFYEVDPAEAPDV